MSSESGSSDSRPDKKQKALTEKTVPDDDVMSSSLLSKGQPIFNIRPSYFDALVLQISQFLATSTANIPNDIIEIEAKFGVYLEKRTSRRWMNSPYNTPPLIASSLASTALLEGILESEFGFKFNSIVDPEWHKFFNCKLNDLVSRQGVGVARLKEGTGMDGGSMAGEALGPSHLASRNYMRISYKHEKTIDRFFQHPELQRLRATFVQAKGDKEGPQLPTSVMAKRRIADIGLLFPRFPFDVRLSINTEARESAACIKGLTLVAPSRLKDRVSYNVDGEYCIDLTRVDVLSEEPSAAGAQNTLASPSYEIEVELLRRENREPRDFEHSAQLLMSTLRSLLSLTLEHSIQ